MQPLASRVRPKSFDDIIGQNHLVGPNGVIRKMIEKEKLFSLILYGNPGTGKTTIANVIMSYFPLNSYSYNASIDNKAKLKEIADGAKYYGSVYLVIDEIHRMKKDTQDFLLPYVEKGELIIIGLTTLNPYRSVNPAVRSRCHIYRLNDINKDDLFTYLKRISLSKEYFENPLVISDEILKYIVNVSNNEVRTALNMLESISLLSDEEMNLENVAKLLGKPQFNLDMGDVNYYDILSAMIKSIRGSHVEASLHYLSRLLLIEDLEMITRRLTILAYEDIGLANPSMWPKVYAACQSAINVGMPEASIILGNLVIDMALSPKSNSGYLAINKAMEDLNSGKASEIPHNIVNRFIKQENNYLYPHDYPQDFVVQEYLPNEINDVEYYIPKKNSKYESLLSDMYYDLRNQFLKKK